MKNQLRAIGVLLLMFGLIYILSTYTIVQKIFVIAIVTGLIYGLYTLVLDIINDVYREEEK